MKLPRSLREVSSRATAALGLSAAPERSPRAGEYLIEDLARIAKTTVRNIRAYQDRGIVPPPERRGRAAIYGEAHLSRLRIIGQLLQRGYTLSSIGELIDAWFKGQDLAGLIGLETAVTSPWTDEVPATYSLVDLVKMYGGSFNPRWLFKATELGILKAQGASFVAPSPRLIRAGSELVKAGIPLDEMLDVVAHLRANVESAAEQMVRLVEKHLFDRFGSGLPPAEEVPHLGEIIWRLRPLVEMAVHAEVARAMELAAHRHIGDRIDHVMALLQQSPATPEHAKDKTAAAKAAKPPRRKKASAQKGA